MYQADALVNSASADNFKREFMNERKWNLDVIRIVSCILVIAIHVVDYGLEIQKVMSADWISRIIISSLSRCSVPVFFMLSGTLFMGKKIPLEKLYKKYIARIFVAWLLWSSAYAFIDFVAALKANQGSLEYFITRIVSGHHHLWFIPVLVVVYMFFPLLQRFMKSCSETEMKYLGVIILITVIGKETLDPFVNSPIWEGLWKNISVPGASDGIIYFVMGYYLEQNQDNISNKTGWILLVLGGAGSILKNICWGMYSGQPMLASYSYLSLDYFLCSVGFFVLLIKADKRIKVNPKVSQILSWVSGYTFGIYLVHAVFIEQVYRRIGLSAADFPVWISPLFFTCATFVLSFMTVWIIKKIPVLGKWIV